LIFVIATPLLGNEATVSWNPHPESRVTGYKIYYGKASRTYTSSVDVGSVTQYTLRGLESGTWYFAVTAYTPGGLESGYSREVSKSIQEDVRPLEILTLDVSLVTHASAVIGIPGRDRVRNLYRLRIPRELQQRAEDLTVRCDRGIESVNDVSLSPEGRGFCGKTKALFG
jgi:hypothetical protein